MTLFSSLALDPRFVQSLSLPLRTRPACGCVDVGGSEYVFSEERARAQGQQQVVRQWVTDDCCGVRGGLVWRRSLARGKGMKWVSVLLGERKRGPLRPERRVRWRCGVACLRITRPPVPGQGCLVAC